MNIRAKLLLAAALLATSFSLVPAGHAGEGEVVELPITGQPKNGLILTFNTQWVASPGYKPIHLELRTDNGLPAKKDRRLTVEFIPRANWNLSQRFTGEILLPQGETSVTGHLLAVQSSQWWHASVNIYENGSLLKDLSTPHGVQITRRNNGFNVNQPTMLVIDSKAPTLLDRAASSQRLQRLRNTGQQLPPDTYDLPDIQGLWGWSPNRGYSGGGQRPVDDQALINQVHDAGNVELLPPEQLPDQWIAYSSVDIIFLSHGELLSIRKKRESLANALKKWTAAGGNLVVYDVGPRYERLSEIEAIIGLKSAARENIRDRWQPGGNASELTPKSLKAYADQEWQIIDQQLRNHPNTNLRKNANELAPLEEEFRDNTERNPDWVPLRVLEYGHGKIIAFPEKDPFPGSHLKWQRFNNAMKPVSNWNERVGIDLEQGDSNFLAYAIPGVGLPPVNTFRLLITLFVIVIGPVNYLLLKRRKRLFLLLVTVPLGAAIVTGSLFSYAIIKDGLNVKARVHSYTYVDQRAGLASSWSRQTYFASLPPSDGLTYPDTAAAFPIYDNSWSTRRSQQSSNRTLAWDDDQQHLRSGYIGSRTTAEFLVASTQPIDQNVTLRFQLQAAGKPPKVTNSLGVEIQELLLVAGDGKSYKTENLGIDASVVPKPQSMSAAMADFKRLAKQHQPTDPYYLNQGNSFFGSRNRWNTTSTVTGQGLLGVGKYTSLVASQGTGQWLEPGEFLAIVPRSPYVPLGVPIEEEEASFHVIRGRYLPE
jgi:hypothetical protein